MQVDIMDLLTKHLKYVLIDQVLKFLKINHSIILTIVFLIVGFDIYQFLKKMIMKDQKK